MRTASFDSQACSSEGRYYIQFETNDRVMFDMVENLCQEMVDICHICKTSPELARIYGYRWDKPEVET